MTYEQELNMVHRSYRNPERIAATKVVARLLRNESERLVSHLMSEAISELDNLVIAERDVEDIKIRLQAIAREQLKRP